MDDAILVCVLNSLADQCEEFDASTNRKPVPVAGREQRQTVHKFHDEVGPASERLSGIEHLRHACVIHRCHCLPLSYESGYNLLGIHTELDDLQRYSPSHRLQLLGLVEQRPCLLRPTG